MTTENTTQAQTETKVEAKPLDQATQAPRRGGDRGGKGGGRRREGDRAPRTKPEFDSTMLNIRRVSRTVSGGRRFSFSVALVAGNKKGMVGVGLGKAGDTALAIDKAMRDAKKNMVKINTTKDMSIPHEVFAKYASARVMLIPAKDRGIVAGSATRNVIELAGIKNVVAKIISPSKNKLNIARATIMALKGLHLVRPTRVSSARTSAEIK
ncbi:MAG TPA: 30S ribosomal protein S5 [Candidatus Paceibacterota bacterium]|jgi:small subunit ribosomal protein S5|nr:30S ribosomal protein S5 [Candidatus Paceibacterota bacterium]